MMALEKPTRSLALAELLRGLAAVSERQACFPEGLQIDSRQIRKGDLFLACRGQQSNGALYIDQAIAAGACAILVDTELAVEQRDYPVALVRVEDLNEKAGLIAHRFYGQPSEQLHVLGITGTNGKTSIAQIMAQVLTVSTGLPVGVSGTLGIGTTGNLQASANTTPDALTLHKALAGMRDAGCEHVVMEVSSHALSQSRVAGINFNSGIFTNLSRDHLDYHADMAAYGEAKRRLFLTESLNNAVINIDDDFGQALLREFAGQLRVIPYGLKLQAEFSDWQEFVFASVEFDAAGAMQLDIRSSWGNGRLSSRLLGAFNASNLLACMASLCAEGMSFTEVLERLAEVDAVPGRMECFSRSGMARVIVDYAHTPDALEKALMSLPVSTEGKLVCVLGCGGDRDKGKRAPMGRIAETYASEVILTNDNPRNEDPAVIFEQILAGVQRPEAVAVIPDRAAAIRRAITAASAGDTVLIAGKGHETWQEIAGVRTPFSDRQLVRNLLEQAG